MTFYQDKLQQLIRDRYNDPDPPQIIDQLFRAGVIDHTLVKVLVIREYVEELVHGGVKKVDAMWQASEVFACTYENVRKCMYYYRDVNLQ